jgi:hypothetical protein
MPRLRHRSRLPPILSVSSRTSIAGQGSGALLVEAGGSALPDEAGPTETVSPGVSMDRLIGSGLPLAATSDGTPCGASVRVDAPRPVAGG